MRSRKLLSLVALCWTAAGCSQQRSPDARAERAETSRGPLRVHSTNPRYFTDNTGKAIYLTGSHVWTNLQDNGPTNPPPALDYNAHLDLLIGYGHNFTRGWAWEQPRAEPGNPEVLYVSPLPFERTGPGTAADGLPKFDVTKFNDEYFARLRKRAQLADQRGMYMGIMLFNGWSIEAKERKVGNPWPYHPFNKANNINGIDGDPNHDDQGFETHALVVPAVTGAQEAYVAKVIDTLNDLENIFWEITNESWEGSVEWQYHMIRFIKEHESKKPKQHLVWMTGYMVPNPSLFASPAECISPCRKDGTNYRGDPPATTGEKIILLDTDHIWGVGGDYRWVWKSFTRGYHPIFMDPMYGLGAKPKLARNSEQWIGARKAMGHTRRYAEKIDLATMSPQPKLCSTSFCLANPGIEYIIYQPAQGPFTLEIPPGEYALEWFDVKAGTISSTDTITVVETRHKFTPPIAGDAVLWIKKRAAAAS